MLHIPLLHTVWGERSTQKARGNMRHIRVALRQIIIISLSHEHCSGYYEGSTVHYCTSPANSSKFASHALERKMRESRGNWLWRHETNELRTYFQFLTYIMYPFIPVPHIVLRLNSRTLIGWIITYLDVPIFFIRCWAIECRQKVCADIEGKSIWWVSRHLTNHQPDLLSSLIHQSTQTFSKLWSYLLVIILTLAYASWQAEWDPHHLFVFTS